MSAQKTTVALVAALFLSGCNDAMETQHSPNGAEAELIAEVDGCRVWRITDWHYVYMARCPEGAAQNIQSTVYCGKNCWRNQQTIGLSETD